MNGRKRRIAGVVAVGLVATALVAGVSAIGSVVRDDARMEGRMDAYHRYESAWLDLDEDDVVVTLDGEPVADWASLSNPVEPGQIIAWSWDVGGREVRVVTPVVERVRDQYLYEYLPPLKAHADWTDDASQ